MAFMEAYKRLDILCADIMNNGRGISSYIEEMSRIPGNAWRIPGWDFDLKQLKHCRWIRNQIAHDPNCNEQNLSTEAEVRWLEKFHRRILEQQDPLTIYRKATQGAPEKRLKEERKLPRKIRKRLIVALMIAIMAVIVIYVLFGILFQMN